MSSGKISEKYAEVQGIEFGPGSLNQIYNLS